jgi:hypothetical protein
MQTRPPLKKVQGTGVAEPNVPLRRSQRLLKKMQMNDILAPPFSKVDFDEASKAWRENKKSIGNGSFKYICCADKNGKKCGIKCIDREIYCRSHYKKFTQML